MRRWIVRVIVVAGAAVVLALVAANLAVANGARGRTYSDVSAIPARRVGLVLGCSRFLWGGIHNSFFDNRIDAAARLMRAGKVKYLVVSGDNHIKGYDEPSDMKSALVEAGVPGDRVFCDYAGLRTLDSVVGVREIFGQMAIIVVSQEFHNQRAIFIGRHRGVDILGFNAAEVDAYDSSKSSAGKR